MLGGALSGVLAYGLMQMDGLQGYAGWRWIFIIEGIFTCMLAVVGFVFLVDLPQAAHKSWGFLSEAEANYIIRRINRDRQDANEEAFTFGRFFKPALDWKVWSYGFMYM